jgi:hypothetical protein
VLPVSKNGTAKKSRIDDDDDDDDDVTSDIAAYLQSLDPWICALGIVQYLAIPAVRQCFNIKKTISLATAWRWMGKMGYQWLKKPGG